MTGVTEAGSAQNVAMASIGGRPFLLEGRASYYVAENDVVYDVDGNAAFHIAHGTRSMANDGSETFHLRGNWLTDCNGESAFILT